MTDPITQIIVALLALAGVVATVWGSIRVGRNATRAQAKSASQEHELGLIDRYKVLLEDTEKRLTARVDDLEAEVKELRDELHTERASRRSAESQRDAAVSHAQELRDAWPGSSSVPPPPPIIADLFRLGTPTQAPPGAGPHS